MKGNFRLLFSGLWHSTIF